MNYKYVMQPNADLKIYTFDKFDINFKGISLTSIFSRYPKIFTLFKFFIANKGKHLNSEFIEENLWEENEYEDLKNTIKGQVFRLRKLIKSVSKEICNGELENYIEIVFIDSCYYLNLKNNYFLDFEEFKKGASKVFLRSSEDEADIPEHEFIINLYTNHFLNNSPNDHWVLPLRNYYKRVFIDLVYNRVINLREGKEEKKALDLLEKVFLIEHLDERLHIQFADILIRQGKYFEALKHYDYIRKQFSKQFDILPSEAMKDLEKVIYGSKYNDEEDNSAINRDLEETLSIIFKKKLVEKEVFERILRLERNLGKSNRIQCALMKISFIDEREFKNNNSFQGIIDAISKSIRKGDVYYLDSFSLSLKISVLLYDIEEGQWNIVKERLYQNFRDITLMPLEDFLRVDISSL